MDTGNANAYTIFVEDTLSPMLDIATLLTVSASHNYKLSIKNGNVLTYWFPSIFLVDSNTNESQSHGFVTFQIKPKASWLVGDSITNKALIYFDYNNAVYTNTVSNILSIPNYVHELKNKNNLNIFPNPTQNLLYVRSTEKYKTIKIVDARGVLVKMHGAAYQKGIDVSTLQPGIYFIELINEAKTERVKFIKH